MGCFLTGKLQVLVQISGFHPGLILPLLGSIFINIKILFTEKKKIAPWGHLAMPGETLGCHTWLGPRKRRCFQNLMGRDQGCCLNVLWCRATFTSYPAPEINSADADQAQSGNLTLQVSSRREPSSTVSWLFPWKRWAACGPLGDNTQGCRAPPEDCYRRPSSSLLQEQTLSGALKCTLNDRPVTLQQNVSHMPVDLSKGKFHFGPSRCGQVGQIQ